MVLYTVAIIIYAVHINCTVYIEVPLTNLPCFSNNVHLSYHEISPEGEPQLSLKHVGWCTCTQIVHVHVYVGWTHSNMVAGYIGGIMFGRLLENRRKIAISEYKFGSTGTIATPSPGVYAILADLILVV